MPYISFLSITHWINDNISKILTFDSILIKWFYFFNYSFPDVMKQINQSKLKILEYLNCDLMVAKVNKQKKYWIITEIICKYLSEGVIFHMDIVLIFNCIFIFNYSQFFLNKNWGWSQKNLNQNFIEFTVLFLQKKFFLIIGFYAYINFEVKWNKKKNNHQTEFLLFTVKFIQNQIIQQFLWVTMVYGRIC